MWESLEEFQVFLFFFVGVAAPYAILYVYRIYRQRRR